jgi:hypothetical protein
MEELSKEEIYPTRWRRFADITGGNFPNTSPYGIHSHHINSSSIAFPVSLGTSGSSSTENNKSYERAAFSASLVLASSASAFFCILSQRFEERDSAGD